jgi:hypothetical protein
MTVGRFDNLTAHQLKVVSGLSFGVNTETLGAAKTLQTDDVVMHFLDPGGSGRDVTLPAEADSEGLMFVIVNTADAAENLTVEDDAASTVGVVGQSEMGIFVCNGTVWRHFTGVA